MFSDCDRKTSGLLTVRGYVILLQVVVYEVLDETLRPANLEFNVIFAIKTSNLVNSFL